MNQAAFQSSGWRLAALLTAAVAAYATMLWLPGRLAISAMEEQLERKRHLVAEAELLSSKLIGCRRQLDAAESAAVPWEKAAPRKKRQAEFFEKINAGADEAGLTIARFNPKSPVDHRKIYEIPLTIDGSGTFSQIYEFLRNVERLPPTLWVESLKIEKSKTGAKNVTYKVDLVGFGDAGSPPADGADKGRLPEEVRQSSWRLISERMRGDPRTTPALPLGKNRDPFEPPQGKANP